MKKINIEVSSPSNIALIKYWGKKEGQQIPLNSSISLTLSKSFTETLFFFEKRNKPRNEFKIEELSFYFNDELEDNYSEKKLRFHKYFLSFLNKNKFLLNYDIVVKTKNSFPEKAGIASSASSFCSFSFGLNLFKKIVLEELTSIHLSELGDDFFNEVSSWSRIGSGSACRSVFGDLSIWGDYTVHKKSLKSKDEYASKINISEESFLKTIRNTILIVDSSEKSISSSSGHKLMDDNPFKDVRVKNSFDRLNLLLDSISDNNWDNFSKIVEEEALELHAMMMTSRPPYILLKPNSLAIIDLIKTYREKHNIRMTFTIDAGPNIHLLYPSDEVNKVNHFIENECEKFLENKYYINDSIGEGSKIKSVMVDGKDYEIF